MQQLAKLTPHLLLPPPGLPVSFKARPEKPVLPSTPQSNQTKHVATLKRVGGSENERSSFNQSKIQELM